MALSKRVDMSGDHLVKVATIVSLEEKPVRTRRDKLHTTPL
jgi:hypothetical protein